MFKKEFKAAFPDNPLKDLALLDHLTQAAQGGYSSWRGITDPILECKTRSTWETLGDTRPRKLSRHLIFALYEILVYVIFLGMISLAILFQIIWLSG